VTTAQRRAATSVLKVLAQISAVLFAVWQIDAHFVTRLEFNVLSANVQRLTDRLEREPLPRRASGDFDRLHPRRRKR